MLSLEELRNIGAMAEDCGYRVNITSAEHAVFLYEYIPNHDIRITYAVIAGELKVRTIAEGVSCDPEELMALCNAVGLSLGLIKMLGGIYFE